ncbi:MAG: hypothetical protein ABIK89_03865 [Planctomycetota bacterium]
MSRRPQSLPGEAPLVTCGLGGGDLETVSMLGDLERCLAWAILEAA